MSERIWTETSSVRVTFKETWSCGDFLRQPEEIIHKSNTS